MLKSHLTSQAKGHMSHLNWDYTSALTNKIKEMLLAPKNESQKHHLQKVRLNFKSNCEKK